MNVRRIVFALLAAVAVAIGCLILAAVLDLVGIKFVSEIADILRTFAPAFGVLAGIVYYLGGRAAGPFA